MMRSLYTGVSGLSNHQTRMDVLSNNIANVNTIGFKGSRTIFSDALSQTMQGATSPQGENRGGINAKQIGLGVKTSSIDILFTKTSFQTTNVNTDLAINNNGFFIVNEGSQSYYTRAGNFYFDRDGNFLTNEGLYVQGWMADGAGTVNTAQDPTSIKIPVTATMPPRVTTYLASSGNLNAKAELGEANSVSKDVYDAQGYDHKVFTMYTKIADNKWLAYSSVSGTDGSSPVTGNAKVLEFDPNGKFVSATDIDTTWIAQANVAGVVSGGNLFENAINLDNRAAAGATAETSIMFMDNDDVVRSLKVLATCTTGETSAGNDAEWRIDIIENKKVIGSSTYSGAGNLPGTVTLSDNTEIDLSGYSVGHNGAATVLDGTDYTDVAFASGNSPLSFMPDQSAGPIAGLQVNNTYDTFTQYAGGFNILIPEQDGYAAGDLEEKTIDASGMIVGKYSNGQTLNLAQLAMAIFNNQQGLERVGSTLFAKSNNSGDPNIGTAGTGGRGTMQAGALEMSNVDLAEEFTNMIVTQRGYQSNSRIITTSDELLQELMNLKR